MIIIDDTILSDNLFKVRFCCDLGACKGACCVDGDAGAPLEEEEISIIEDYIDEIKSYMNDKGRAIIEQNGVFDYDDKGDFVTPLVNDNECAFVYFEKGIAFCAIEKACLEDKISFKKPISCHLYPVRLSKLSELTAINYHEWQVCSPATKKGENLGLLVYQFLKEPLIRKFGEDWYQKLEDVAEKENKKK